MILPRQCPLLGRYTPKGLSHLLWNNSEKVIKNMTKSADYWMWVISIYGFNFLLLLWVLQIIYIINYLKRLSQKFFIFCGWTMWQWGLPWPYKVSTDEEVNIEILTSSHGVHSQRWIKCVWCFHYPRTFLPKSFPLTNSNQVFQNYVQFSRN